MSTFARLVMFTALSTVSASLSAQARLDPAGHWEGTIQAPDRTVSVAVDLAADNHGTLAGTFTHLADGVKGLPFASVAADGRQLRLVLRAGAGGGTFNANLSSDGTSMSGDFVTAEGGFALPFTLTRTGDARLTPAPKSAAVAKGFEGTWNGTLDASGRQVRLILTLANQSDGTSKGTLASPDAGDVQIPIAVASDGRRLTLEMSALGASFAGALSESGLELSGTWKERSASLALTFRKATP
jgi:hypothetical protein